METVFKALADPTRIAVVERLALGEISVGQLAAPFGMALPSFMQHLKVLEDAGLVSTEKRGRTRFCSLQVESLKSASSWLDVQRSRWNRRLDQLDSYLIAMQG